MKRHTHLAIIGPTFNFCRTRQRGAQFPSRLMGIFLAVALLLFCGKSLASTALPAQPTTVDSTAPRKSPTPGVDPTALKQFVHDYWQQRFTQHAQRVNWRDYQWQIEVSIPDAVSKLPPCRQPYQPEDSQVKFPVGRHSLRLRCPDSPGWVITTRSQISVLMPVVVARVATGQEHYLQESDLAVTQVLLTPQMDDVLTSPAQAIGRRPQRSLRAGQPVRNRMLEAAMLVRKGDKVNLTLAEGEMAISMQGTALQDGQKGETISIKNEKSGKVISASVSGPGQLLILNEAPVANPQH
ncbi:flagellar basal body P-ring formation chaperone FlgA [Citrobacter sp. Awk 4]|uniref:flagellar basal body P-ring formation chaperone FlgA n=1 Tax=Citrobacter sp. Awk 4 TaxID=2963955 RepID=UPI00230342DC|nr:flagellar basal body P-ring formation chaperone FlgA [Citrobacter sp. Awk 4]MDA8479952.1 flagellar basal body P-ring formation chaperone FlgA [Citrobacter sp. Awk 4]